MCEGIQAEYQLARFSLQHEPQRRLLGNAPMESFWGKMKSEWLSDKYAMLQQTKRDVYEYVWHFYPKERPHETFGYLTPDEFYRQGKNEV